MKSYLIRFVIVVFVFLPMSSLFATTELSGIVVSKNGDLAQVEIQQNISDVPKTGDKVVFSTTIEGTKIEAGLGIVSEVNGNMVSVNVQEGQPDLNMLAVININEIAHNQAVGKINKTPPQHLCDELAGDPWDKQRIGPIIKISSIDTDKAIKACSDALKTYPATPRFLYQLARAYRTDWQFDKALYYYQLAADYDYAAAQFGVGWIYERGKGVKSDDAKAAEWFRKAVLKGHAIAQYELGMLYEGGNDFGNGPKKDRVKAKEWFLKAAKQGYAPAQGMVGYMYQEGVGEKAKDYKKARQWFLKSADQGSILSLQDLGMMSSEGQGMPGNYGEAAKWYRKLAMQCDAFGQYSLGELYLQGKGVPKNKNEAIFWFFKAASGGNKEAKLKLEKMDLKLDELELEYIR